ncbi:hypothetical protein MBANPS3_010252 [Mucor bainieri]
MRISCSVCLEEVTEDSELVALTVCGHIFDAECITQCMLVNYKCPLCNQSTLNGEPAFKRVYFSALEGDGKDDLKVLKQELAAARDDLDTVNHEYDDLALRCTALEDKLITSNCEKEQLEKDNALKDAKIDKVTHNWQAAKARNKDDMDRMNLVLISKQKSIDLLKENLGTSNKRIKSLKGELVALKSTNSTQDTTLPYQSRYKDQQNFKTKYYDLNKEHRALKDKMGQLEKKFIDLTLATSEPPSSMVPSKTDEALQSRIQLLEKQAQSSTAKESKLLKDVMRFKQLKQDAIKEKEELQAKLARAEAAIASLEEHSTQKDEASCRQQ